MIGPFIARRIVVVSAIARRIRVLSTRVLLPSAVASIVPRVVGALILRESETVEPIISGFTWLADAVVLHPWVLAYLSCCGFAVLSRVAGTCLMSTRSLGLT